jgi:integrase
MSQWLNTELLQFDENNIGFEQPVVYDYLDGKRTELCRFADINWPLPDKLFSNNTSKNRRKIRFKDNAYLYHQKRFSLHWLAGKFNQKPSSVVEGVKKLNLFLEWLDETFDSKPLSEINLMTVQQYVDYRKKSGKGRNGKKGVAPGTIALELVSLRKLCECLKGTVYEFKDPIEEYTPDFIAGTKTKVSDRNQVKTTHIPFSLLTEAFQWSETLLNNEETLIASNPTLASQYYNNPLLELRSACYFIIMITTGMRIHELGYIKSSAIKTIMSGDEQTYILKSKSSKTLGTGKAEVCTWIVPEITKRAITTLEKLVTPLHQKAKDKVEELRALGDTNSLTEALRIEVECIDSLLVIHTRTVHFSIASDVTMTAIIQKIFNNLNLEWKFHCHQSRRTYARLVAKHMFGDLRVLVEQMKHASMDMTAGYGHDDSVDLSILQNIDPELRELIEEEFGMVVGESKLEVATATHLSGGAGRNLIQHRHKTEKWRKNGIAVKTYDDKDLAQILETTPLFGRGHAYCMNDQGPCDSFDCVNCDSGVITESHLDYWKALWQQQAELLAVSENNPQIKAVVEYNQRSARQVFTDLGVDISEVESAA